jgi:hypothetical protein
MYVVHSDGMICGRSTGLLPAQTRSTSLCCNCQYLDWSKEEKQAYYKSNAGFNLKFADSVDMVFCLPLLLYSFFLIVYARIPFASISSFILVFAVPSYLCKCYNITNFDHQYFHFQMLCLRYMPTYMYIYTHCM